MEGRTPPPPPPPPSPMQDSFQNMPIFTDLILSLVIFMSAIRSHRRCDTKEGEEGGVEQASQEEDGRKNK